MEALPRVGRYELLEHVGNGSMGMLYRGQDTVLGREVAVKVMASGFLGDQAAHARFFREARAAARLQHVNIVTIFEFGEHEETPYIVMEFLRGSSLADRLRRGPAMSLREKLDTAIQLCAGLEAAHAQGVVHRDVKPQNVWLCQDGTVKLLDFGIATAASTSGTFADILGNPGYLSPEQIAGGKLDARTDVFSAGVVFYEMLSGRRPFEADSPTGVMMRIVNDAPDPLDDPELPAAVGSAVGRALEKAPAERYARASEFARDLKAIKAGLPLAPEPATMFIERTVVDTPVEPRKPSPRGFDMAAVREQIEAVREQLAALPPERVRMFAMIAAGVVLAVLLLWVLWPDSELSGSAGSGGAASPPVRTDGGAPGSAVASKPGTGEPPAGTTPPPPPPATLRVSSTPPAARILLDGQDSGRVTPAVLELDPAKPPTRIELELAGFAAEPVTLTPETLRGGALDVPLAPVAAGPPVTLVATGPYRFDVMDRQRVVSADSQRHDVVVSGLRTVQLRADRYFLNQTVRLDRAADGTVRATAPPLGSISVYAAGALEDCKVLIDDRLVDSGSLPVADRQIASGSHRVRLRCSRGDTDAQPVTVLPGQGVSARFPASTPVRPR
jgi:hypothetical protein